MKRDRRVLIGLALLGLFAWFGWPTPWEYSTETQGTKLGAVVKIPVRFHRLSGEKQTYYHEDGWQDGSIIVD